MFMPFQVLGFWLRALLSLALIAGGITLLTLWYQNREVEIVERRTPDGDWTRASTDTPDMGELRTRRVSWEFGLNRETAYLLGGVALLVWSFGGGWLIHPRLLRRSGSVPDAPRGEVHTIKRADGTTLHVEVIGPPNAATLIFIHGWSLNSEEWAFAKNELSGRFRLVTWDLPGLGHSTEPADHDFSLEKMATDLDTVIDAVSLRPAVLVGHSIGGMIILTYCKLFPAKVASRVQSLVIAHSTYTNPVKTTRFAGLAQALQKPVLEPMAHLMIWLSPVVRLFNWMSYVNGSAHRSTERSSFSGRETRGQLDSVTRQYVVSDPSVVGRGFLAMFNYEATAVLPTIPVPVLVVTADDDRTCLPEASQHMARVIPMARLVSLGDSRHCGVFEMHDSFHAAIAAFVTEQDRATPGEPRPSLSATSRAI